MVAGLSRIGEDAVDPPMQMLRTLPHFGLIPLFIVWMGIGEAPKIALIAMGVAFPLYLNTFAGIRSIDRKMSEAALTMGLTRRQRLRHVVIPGALPQALVGLRQSLGVAWLSLIVAETVSADSGLGYMINHAREFLQTDVIVVGPRRLQHARPRHRLPGPSDREEGAGMALLTTRPKSAPATRRPSATPWPRCAATTAPSAARTCCAART